MISIVTGTLDRLNCLKLVVENTVDSNDLLELVLIDGGSTDGTLEYLKELNHPRIKLIEEGKRSYYWDYMNLGIRNSSYEWVCQWNDDVMMETPWDLIIEEIEKNNPKDFYIFSWRERNGQEYFIYDGGNELVLNYGIYNKKIFREIGMYDSSYKYYYCDGDLSYRAKQFGFSYEKMYNIKCESLTGPEEKKAITENHHEESENYRKKLEMYRNNILPETVEYLWRYEKINMNPDKVISFSVFGDSPKYCVGMLRNLEISETLFPEWKIYIYHNNTVPEHYIESYKKFKNSKLIDMTSHNIPGMFWRFLPFAGVERFICRDSDSRLIERDKLAVEEWIQEDTDLHIMRDHPHHHYKILGGMWGLKVKENLLDLIEKYTENKDKNLFTRMVDMDFLRDVIYPIYIGNSTVHISLDENRMENHCKSFPKKMEDFRFIGEIINEDESREYQYKIWIDIQEI